MSVDAGLYYYSSMKCFSHEPIEEDACSEGNFNPWQQGFTTVRQIMKCHQVGIVRSKYVQVPKTTVGQKFCSVYVMLLLSKNVTLLRKWPQGEKSGRKHHVNLVQVAQCFQDVFLLQLNSLSGMLLRQLVYPATAAMLIHQTQGKGLWDFKVWLLRCRPSFTDLIQFLGNVTSYSDSSAQLL